MFMKDTVKLKYCRNIFKTVFNKISSELFYKKNKKRSDKGMALILVLGSIVILTTMAVEFAYNTNVNYHLARNEVDRLKAEYLAKSAFNFMQVELKFDRVFRQIVQSQNLGQYLGGNASLPLCQQFPLSTALIRAVFMSGEEGGALPEEFKGMVSVSAESDAQDFLDFEGDFDGECIDEATKINLNIFSNLDPAQKVGEGYNQYDSAKIDLANFLGKESYRELFEKAGVKVGDVVRNIADWVDPNEMINEIGGVEAGPEIVLYERTDAKHPIKNGKLTTLDEVYLVDGVIDEWFFPVMKFFTIYGDGAVNICRADILVIQNVIRRYVERNPNLPPIRLDDPETMEKLVAAVSDGCSMGGIGDQQKQQIATSLDAAIGALGGTVERDENQPETPPASGQSILSQMITSESRFFRLVLTGSVGDISVKINAVLDVGDANPNRWKLLYWRLY